jgi:hypothetical protein
MLGKGLPQAEVDSSLTKNLLGDSEIITIKIKDES